jgi:hypothetical protein
MVAALQYNYMNMAISLPFVAEIRGTQSVASFCPAVPADARQATELSAGHAGG